MHYLIRVNGHLDTSWQAWFAPLQLVHEATGTTTLFGTLPDQAALYGMLAKINRLGLALLAVESRATASATHGALNEPDVNARTVRGKVARMSTEQTENGVELQQLEPQPIVSVRATIRVAELNTAHDDMLRTLAGYLQRSGATHTGPPFVRYHTFGDTESNLEIGVPVAEPAAGEDRVTTGTLPVGPAVTTWHLGSHDRLSDAYQRIQSWVNKHNREPNGAGWEVYSWIDPSLYDGTATWPDPADWRTQLVQPIREIEAR